MHDRPLRWASILSLGALLLFAGTAAADTLLADANLTTDNIQGSKFLGDVAPGGEVSAEVAFRLTCAGLQHVDAGQSVVLSFSGGGTVPEDGAVVSVTTATLAPPASPWAADLEGCPSPTPFRDDSARSRVTLRAPTTTGTHTFTIVWDRSFQPEGTNDSTAFSRTMTSVDLSVRVLSNSAPVLTVPDAFEVQGNVTGGWTADWSGVSATDAEDDPDPTPSCTPAAGDVVPLDTTTVVCSVRDRGGASDTESFEVTVVDTIAPTLAGVPGDRSVSTTSAGGAAVTFTDPTATDIVDASPTVRCSPASGWTFPVGTTPVTCTATDKKQNSSSETFDVTVRYDEPAPPHTADAVWLEPVAGSSGTFVANRNRTIPVKVRLFVDGGERSAGDAGLSLAPCGGGNSWYRDLVWSGGRWNYAIDTGPLSGSCYVVTATIDGWTAGSFTLEIRPFDAGGRGATAATTRVVEPPAGSPAGKPGRQDPRR